MAKDKQIKIALAGNPNCGKTTIFNNITGAKQHVGNYAGVTVEKKEGEYNYNGQELLFVDLPGTYSLTARSLDELVARNVIINDKPDVIVNVVDASNLERNLYLTAQLLELERPMVIVLNMIDVAHDMGLVIDKDKLASLTGATVVETVGRNNVGTMEVLEAIVHAKDKGISTTAVVDYEEINDTVDELTKEVRAASVEYPPRWVAAKLLEGDADVIGKIMREKNTEALLAKRESMRQELAKEVDLESVFQEKRHAFAVKLFNAFVTKTTNAVETKSDRIDKILTHRILGLPIFLFFMWLLFNIVINVGAYPQDWLNAGVSALSDFATNTIPEGNLQSLIVDGIIAGVGAVISFLPLIILLFLGISFMEDSGYMARAAFLMDRAMRACGLHGKSFIPLLLGFGCSIPSIMGSRILDNYKDRMVTILVTPFMSCGARLPVYVLMASAFFPAEYSGTVLFLTYLFGVIMAVIMAKIFRRFLFSGEAEPFVMELPPYHMPTAKSVLMHMWERAWAYIKKAGTFILGATILIWFLSSYPKDTVYTQDYDAAHDAVETTFQAQGDAIKTAAGYTTDEQKEQIDALVEEIQNTKEKADADAEEAEEDAPDVEVEDPNEAPDVFNDLKSAHEKEFPVAWAVFQNDLAKDAANDDLDNEQASEDQAHSYLGQLGAFMDPALRPLGFNGKMGVSLLAGFTAKEVIISTLGTTYAVAADKEDDSSLVERLQADESFTPLVAVGFLAFIVIYPPCFAAMAVVKRETNSWKWLGFAVGYGVLLAYVVALLIHQIGMALGF